MREILFRGKQINDGGWVEGHYVYDMLYDTHCIKANQPTGGDGYIDPHVRLFTYEISPSTVGQYTGLPDKNGTKLFEGDIVKNFRSVGVVIFNDGRFLIEWRIDSEGWSETLWVHAPNVKKIGNIHDNPELLERTDKPNE